MAVGVGVNVAVAVAVAVAVGVGVGAASLKTRNSGPPLPWVLPSPEAKTVCEPSGKYFRMSPGPVVIISATKRLPSLSKAMPRGWLRPVANVLSTPNGSNSRIASGSTLLDSVDTKRLPWQSKIKPTGL